VRPPSRPSGLGQLRPHETKAILGRTPAWGRKGGVKVYGSRRPSIENRRWQVGEKALSDEQFATCSDSKNVSKNVAPPGGERGEGEGCGPTHGRVCRSYVWEGGGGQEMISWVQRTIRTYDRRIGVSETIAVLFGKKTSP